MTYGHLITLDQHKTKHMNPYIEKRERIEFLKINLEDLFKEQIDLVKDINNEIENVYKELYEIERSCNHLDENGHFSRVYIGQDPGSGKSEFECAICNKAH